MELNDAKALALALMTQHGVIDEGWTFSFDRATSRMGLCHYTKRTISVSQHFAAHATVEQVTDTVLHEIAHVIAGNAAKHGPRWRAHASRLGATPRACGDNPYATRDEALEANLRAVAGKPFMKVSGSGKYTHQRYRILNENAKSYKLVDEEGHLLRAAKEFVYPEGSVAPTMADAREAALAKNLAAVRGNSAYRVEHTSYRNKRYSILRDGKANVTLVDLATGRTMRCPKRLLRPENVSQRLGAMLSV